jgi:hypothetical protein
MSARLNMNPTRYFSWKGKTFSQVTTAIQKNTATIPLYNNNIRNLFLPRPLKIFRREIASSTVSRCNVRTSVKIDELDRPNGYLVYKTPNTHGLNNTEDINLTTNKSQLSTPACSTSTNCMNQAQYARRRVRSSGMMPKKFNATKNNDQYYSSTSQYLNSRNRTFQQNQYNFIRQGDSKNKPGSALAVNNLYSANGLNHCSTLINKTPYVPVFYKPNNSQYATQGAVDSSARITRKIYDTLTTVGSKLRTPQGSTVSNSLAYRVPTGTFSYIKDSGKAFPVKLTPIINPYTGKLTKCQFTRN